MTIIPQHGRYVLFIGLFAALGGFFYGYDSGVATTTIGHPSFIMYMNNPSHDLIGAISSAYIGGQAIGALIQVAIGDRMGRIGFLKLLAIITTLGTIIQTAATSIGMFVGGRALSGLGAAPTILTLPLYLSEIAPAHRRGLIGSLSGPGILFGVVVSYWIGYACQHASDGQVQWRLPVALQIPWSVLFLFGLFAFTPESPRQLVKMGRIDEARQVYSRLHAGQHEDEAEADHEFKLMHAQIVYELEREVKSIREIFRLHSRRVIICAAVTCSAALAGDEAIGYFQTVLYASIGIHPDKILVLVAVNGTISFIGALLSSRFLMDRMGRRNLLLWGMAGTIVTLVYCAIMQWKYQDTNNQIGKGFAVLGIYVYTLINAAAFAGGAGLYEAEILPITIRNKMLGLAGFVHFSIAVGLVEASPTAFTTIRQNYYYVFIGCTVFFFIFGYFFYPETKDKTLEEIAASFGDRVVDVDDSEEGREQVEVTTKLPAEKKDDSMDVEHEVKPQRMSVRWSHSKRWSKQQILGFGGGM